MTTVNVDLAAVQAALTTTEKNRMITRGTTAQELVNVATQCINDLNKALQNIYDMCDATNQTATAAIQAKLLP